MEDVAVSVYRWLARSKNIQEVRLEGNLIGDSAARELLLGLQQRKEGISTWSCD